MSYFQDLSPYEYLPKSSGESRSPLLHVGWLEQGRSFPSGSVEDDFIEKLAWLCVEGTVRRTRGFHICSLCPPSTELGTYNLVFNGEKRLLGTAEIQVAGDQASYAAPNLLIHYVVDHGYLPPEDFISGVLRQQEKLQRSEWTLFRGPYY